MAYTQLERDEQERTQNQTMPEAKRRAESRIKRSGFIPAVSLFFLAPLVGEFLLGNLPITWLWALISLAPLYGGGALLIRETTRRLGLGWPSMVIFGLVYAIVEEAFVTQSLFNPNYVGLRLLDYGYISSLGISAWWSVFVLGIHAVWSTAVPIALVESFTLERRRTPWLGVWGLIITVILFALGCFMTFFFQQEGDPFMASTPQFVVSAIVVVVLAAIAIMLGRIQKNAAVSTAAPPSELAAGGSAFVLGSAFMALANVGEPVPAALPVAGMLGLLAVGSYLFWRWSRREGWSVRHGFALAAGLLLVYAWYGFVQVPSAGDTSPMIDAIGNAIMVVGALILLFFGWRRVSAA